MKLCLIFESGTDNSMRWSDLYLRNFPNFFLCIISKTNHPVYPTYLREDQECVWFLLKTGKVARFAGLILWNASPFNSIIGAHWPNQRPWSILRLFLTAQFYYFTTLRPIAGLVVAKNIHVMNQYNGKYLAPAPLLVTIGRYWPLLVRKHSKSRKTSESIFEFG